MAKSKSVIEQIQDSINKYRYQGSAIVDPKLLEPLAKIQEDLNKYKPELGQISVATHR